MADNDALALQASSGGSVTSTSRHFRNAPRGDRDYLFRSFFVRTLSFTIGRFTFEESRVLLRRRRRSNLASAEKK